MKHIKKILPLIVLLTLFVLAYLFDVSHYISFKYLQEKHQILTKWTETHFVLSSFIFCLSYIIAVAISIPGASFLTITGGFLFGVITGSFYVVISATIGASIIFLIAKSALGGFLENKAKKYQISKFSQGFNANAFNYLLTLRLIPLFPFWLINIVPALFNVRTSTYVLSTFLGIIPGSIVYVFLGNGMTTLITENQTPNFHIIFKPTILLPLIGLSILSLMPIIYKKYKSSKS